MAPADDEYEVVLEQYLRLQLRSLDALVQHCEQNVEIGLIEARHKLRDCAAADDELQCRPFFGDTRDCLGQDLVEDPRARRYAERDRAGGRAVHALEVLASTSEFGRDRARTLAEDDPGFGHPHAARAALQKLGT